MWYVTIIKSTNIQWIWKWEDTITFIIIEKTFNNLLEKISRNNKNWRSIIFFSDNVSCILHAITKSILTRLTISNVPSLCSNFKLYIYFIRITARPSQKPYGTCRLDPSWSPINVVSLIKLLARDTRTKRPGWDASISHLHLNSLVSACCHNKNVPVILCNGRIYLKSDTLCTNFQFLHTYMFYLWNIIFYTYQFLYDICKCT